ncbi:FAD-binding oxidoreductase [Actinoplanes solisilvae]|uniref:FAD-binding oxidoreductase n=1 Tax=Actinoplanes solisilvae TaxID=2486853 RepID=UPI0013E3C727|nr:FAD-binding protein [Actinoplanes solisilvae]
MSDNTAVAALRKAAAEVYGPGDAGYDEARTTWTLGADLRPAAVVFPRSADEVSAVVRAAAAEGLRVSPSGGGHNVFPLPDLSGTVLLRTARLGEISISPDTEIARVGSGVVWLPVVGAAADEGLAGLHGSAIDVGVVGYTTGGGLSWYGRPYGLAANRVTAVELVLADGAQVRADANHEADLFWALRGGGGGNFGVVTALEFALMPFENVYAGLLAWDLESAPRVLERFRTWTADLPDSITSIYRHAQFPPHAPQPWRGRQWVIIDATVLDSDADAERLLAPLRELKPEVDTFKRVPVTDVPHLHMDPEGPSYAVGDSRLLDGLPQSAVEMMLSLAGPGSGFGLVFAEFRHLGGALGRADPAGGALSYLDGAYNMFAVGASPTAEGRAAARGEINTLIDAVAVGNSHGRRYLGFHQAGHEAHAGYDDATWVRLGAIRSRVDPGRVLMANHSV